MINKYEVPKNWALCQLKDIGQIVSGGTPSTKENSFWGDDVAWITPADLSGYTEKYISKGRKSITEKGLQNSSAKIIPKGSVLFSSRAPIGYVAIASNDLSTNQGFKNVVPYSSVNSIYLYYYLKSIKELAVENASGTTFKEISGSKFSELPFLLPPLSEQERIVAKIEELFSELDAGLESLKTAAQQLKTYRQAVLKYAFEGKLTNDNVNEGELPSGWKWVKFEEIGNAVDPQPSHRTPPKVENGIPYVSTKDFDFELDKIDFSGARIVSSEVLTEHLERYQLEIGDFVIGKIGTIGKPVRIVLPQNYTLSANIILIQPRKANSTFLYYLFQSNVIEKEFTAGKKATTQAAFGIQKVRLLNIPLPTLEEQQCIVEEIESRLSVCDKLEETINASLKQAEALRQSILKQAFEGKLIAQEQEIVYQPKNEYFYKVQVMAFMLIYFRRRGFRFGEMVSAKNAYLLHKIFGIPFYKEYKRWHLGPFSPEIYEVINKKKFFKINGGIEVLDEATIFKYSNPYQQKIEDGVNELAEIYESFADSQTRSHKIELLATVCKVIEDIQTTDLTDIRKSMTEWVIDLKNKRFGNKDEKFNNKAEKFREDETVKCLEFIKQKGWDKKLIK